jgi:hypothetical protein
MRASAAIQHHQELFAAERDFIASNYSELAGQVVGLPDTELALSRHEPGHERGSVASKTPLPLHELLDAAFSDLYRVKRTAQILDFVGSVVLPQIGIESLAPAVSGELHICTLVACRIAEGYFANTLRQMEGENPIGELQPRITVYYNGEGVPLALEKAALEKSALLLEPVVMGDITLPTGTIVSVDPKIDKAKSGQARAGDNGFITYQVEDGGFDIMPGRLSPWAYDQAIDRSLFAISGGWAGSVNYDAKHGQMIEERTIEDFRQAAHKVMGLVEA